MTPGDAREADPAARAETLLDATNRFVSARDLDELARTIITVVRAVLDPWKGLLTLVGADGRSRAAEAVGYDAGEIRQIEGVLAAGGPLSRRALRGEELWSDEDGGDEIRARIAVYGGRSGFTLPIVTTRGVAGNLSVIYADDRPFDPPFREAVRSLCGQAALALELIATRDDLRRNAAALEHQTRVTSALFEVSQRLAIVDDPTAIPSTLAAALRAATGASYAVVGQWDPSVHRVRFVAVDGVRPEERRRIESMDASPERFRMIRGGLEGRANVRVPPFDPDDVPVELVEALGLTAIGGAAVVVDGRPWGVIAVGTRAGDPSIVATGAELLSGIASIAASAIGRAQATAALALQASVLESSIAERTIQLREAVEELRLASQAKSDLLANVSHELRTPLTAILGFSEVLLQGLDGRLTPEQVEDVRTIDRSGRHLLELIDDLLDVARIEAGRVRLRTALLDPDPLVRAAVDEVRPLAAQKGLSISAAIGALPATIVGDPSRIHEILLNLLSNAVKFTPPGGRIEVTATGDEAGIAVDVADTGIGIAAEHHGIVFEKFHRVVGPEYPGTGLGLAIAREYARLHGGDLALESEPGRGSTFTLRLPLEPPAAGSPSEPGS